MRLLLVWSNLRQSNNFKSVLTAGIGLEDGRVYAASAGYEGAEGAGHLLSPLHLVVRVQGDV